MSIAFSDFHHQNSWILFQEQVLIVNMFNFIFWELLRQSPKIFSEFDINFSPIGKFLENFILNIFLYCKFYWNSIFSNIHVIIERWNHLSSYKEAFLFEKIPIPTIYIEIITAISFVLISTNYKRTISWFLDQKSGWHQLSIVFTSLPAAKLCNGYSPFKFSRAIYLLINLEKIANLS